jgi:hypothetical protein
MRIEIDDVIFILQNIAIVLISAILFKYARYILKFLTPLQEFVIITFLYAFLYLTRHSTFNFLRTHSV